ncbi:putative serine/threonine-protein kinase [Cladorrhinum samala]|uniref:Serine/threonine-protein kinase n=1 Tax=Cladorrhinum samala TaxID=585594 RepID=A0AAV9HBZ6_9PEZI|nr:putative serine/threonine-protein kinase [Cladorrhinum samala]
MIAQATPALKTVRGFTSTPVVSGDEDSDHCPTPHLFGKKTLAKQRGRTPNYIINDVVSENCSPVLKPVNSPGVSGIGKLRMQIESLSLSCDTTAASSRASSMTRSEHHSSDTTISSIGSNRGRHDSRPISGGSKLTKSRTSSGDETVSEAGSTSYEINLEHDFSAGDVIGNTSEDGTPLLSNVIEGGVRPPAKMTAEDFEPLKCLGKGAYGTVLLVKQRTTGRLFAQKQFKKASLVVHKKLIEQTKTERQILESVNRHPFVVKLYYAFQDQEKLYLILEYGQGGELFHHLDTEKMFSQETAAFYMAEMVLALSHLHDNLGVVYRDLKPENCLLDSEGHLLLTDFGLSKVAVDSDGCNSILGTVEYMAPEVILGKKYGKAVDWWSLGALGYDLMTGNPPFRGPNNAKIQDNIVKQKLVMPYFLGPDAKDLLTRLLRKEPSKRLGSNMPKDLQIIKGHRFFRKIDWKKLEARELEPPIQPMITDPELAENFSTDFTELSLSPVVTRFDLSASWGGRAMPGAVPRGGSEIAKDDQLFGGFSFVASSSLIESQFMAGGI